MAKILFIGFGIYPKRQEAVSINYNNHVKYVLTKKHEYYVYSLPINRSYFKYITSFPKYFREINDLIYRKNIDTIHDMFVLPGLSLLFQSFMGIGNNKLRFIKEIHNNHGYTRNFRFESLLRIVFSSKFIIKFVINKFDFVYSRSKYVSKYWKINYIPQFIPLYSKKHVVFDKKTLKFCYMGHALGKKGIDVFPGILKNIPKDNSGNIVFNFAFSTLGNRKIIQRTIKQSIKNTNIEVNFNDNTTAQDFFRKNHFFILPLKDEYSATSVPNTMLEAMEAGCIPVVSRNNIVKEVISDFKNGIYIKKDLGKQINDLISDFYTNTGKYGKISKESQKYIRLNHNLNNITNEFNKIYGN